jgi:hypothetical protein
MPFYPEELHLVFRLVHNQVIRGKKNIDSHIRIIEIFRVKEFPKLFTLLWRAEEG